MSNMTPKREPLRNDLGRVVTADDLPQDPAWAAIELSEHHDAIWQQARPHLNVRDNDVHTLYAYGLGRALLACTPDADPEVVLPAILLHDIGWSKVPADEILLGIAPGSSRPDLVLLHEKEGAKLAHQILTDVGHDPARIDEVIQIIDRRPCCIGVWTKERKGSRVFSKIGPRLSVKPSGPATIASRWSQICSSSQSSTLVSGSHWKYIRWTVSVRWLISARPRSLRQ